MDTDSAGPCLSWQPRYAKHAKHGVAGWCSFKAAARRCPSCRHVPGRARRLCTWRRALGARWRWTVFSWFATVLEAGKARLNEPELARVQPDSCGAPTGQARQHGAASGGARGARGRSGWAAGRPRRRRRRAVPQPRGAAATARGRRRRLMGSRDCARARCAGSCGAGRPAGVHARAMGDQARPHGARLSPQAISCCTGLG